MRRRLPALLSVLVAAACGDDSSATGATTSSTNPTSTTSATGTTSATSTTSATAATTTGFELCNFGTSGGSGGAPGPWLELYAYGELLVDGATLSLICGGQGTFMFEVRPKFGGFTPASEFVTFDVTLDIDGHAGPTGHFSSTTPEIFVACSDEPYDFYIDTFQMLVFDDLASIAELDGLPGHLRVSFTADGETITSDIDLTIDAAPSPNWEFCIYEDTFGSTTDVTTTTDSTTTDATTTDATTTDATTTGTTGP